jgi:DNA-binding CsgD family transcriptional regulator
MMLATADLEFARGDIAAARDLTGPLLMTIATIPLKAAVVCEVAVLAIEVAVAGGRLDAARDLADTYLPRLRATDVAWVIGEADRAEAILLAAVGHVDRARRLSDAAVATSAPLGMPMLHARALLTAGEIRRRSRQKAQAREALTAAISILERLDSRLWLDRARSELDRVATRRPDGAPLTATERAVVDLVAAGRTNKEIADALFMSVHTVEAHLTRLFRSLGVQTRTELARLVLDGMDPRLTQVESDAPRAPSPARQE